MSSYNALSKVKDVGSAEQIFFSGKVLSELLKVLFDLHFFFLGRVVLMVVVVVAVVVVVM